MVLTVFLRLIENALKLNLEHFLYLKNEAYNRLILYPNRKSIQ